jgi:hypothetical protein
LGCGWLVVALCAGCDDSDDGDGDEAPQELTDFERGTIVDTRWDACGVERWRPLSVDQSMGIMITTTPDLYDEEFVECVLAAKSCKEVVACNLHFLMNEDDLSHWPVCDDDEPSGHCDGDVVKYCTTDDDLTWHEVSYDCKLAGATCTEGVDQSDRTWADCLAPVELCDGKDESYCDGTKAVICGTDPNRNFHNAGVFDCADAFGSECARNDQGEVHCEGPNITEWPCDDTVDNDDDGLYDCDDPDCSAECD